MGTSAAEWTPSAGYQMVVGSVRVFAPRAPEVAGVARLASTNVDFWIPTANVCAGPAVGSVGAVVATGAVAAGAAVTGTAADVVEEGAADEARLVFVPPPPPQPLTAAMAMMAKARSRSGALPWVHGPRGTGVLPFRPAASGRRAWAGDGQRP